MTEFEHDIDEQAVRRLEQQGACQHPADLKPFLPDEASPQFLGTLQELVVIDLEFQWRNYDPEVFESGEGTVKTPPKTEAYLAEFPPLNQRRILRFLLKEEFTIRLGVGDRPTIEEFMDRFPRIITSAEQLDPQAPSTPVRRALPKIDVGSRIGNFELIQEIGEGGMGSVYQARQLEPVRREVALKVIRSGLKSADVIARFEAERQALALMDHRNIARILDAGTTEEGLPFFAMELVDGIPVTEFCDQHRMDLQSRLQLFVDICAAVQHAHQKGIIHRDLKPSNILVAMEEDGPTVKVIDFGLAKALDHRNLLTDRSMMTQFGQVMGTLKYMSPEQAAADHFDVDTRTDIYALGVILYELLTGSTPIDQQTMQDQALFSILEMIRDQEPPRPSAKLSTLHETATQVTQQRRTDPQRLGQILRGDLDWVVMKALEKDRRRRYETASAFADDVQRYLTDEPVVARPPSAIYRFQKTLRKNRWQILTAASLLLLLIAGIVGTSVGMIQANRARIRAEASENDAKDARDEEARARRFAEAKKNEAEQQRNEANRQRNQAKQEKIAAEKALERTSKVLDFVVDSFRRPDPSIDGRKVTVAQVLQQALDELQLELDDDPEYQAELLLAIAETFEGLGIYDRSLESAELALPIASRAYGDNHRKTLRLRNIQAVSLYGQGKFESAEEILTDVFARQREQFGERDSDTLVSMNNLANCIYSRGDIDRAMELMQKKIRLQIEIYGPVHPDVLISANNLASYYEGQGKNEEAIKIYRRNVFLQQMILGRGHPDTLAAASSLANLLEKQGNLEDSVNLLEQTVERRSETLGPTHPNTFFAKARLAMAYLNLNRISQARELVEVNLPQCRSEHGPDDPSTLELLSASARVDTRYLKIRPALASYQDLVERSRKILGEKNLITHSRYLDYALSLKKFGKFDVAIEKLREVRLLSEGVYQPTHPFLLDLDRELAYCLSRQGIHEEAIVTFKSVLERTREKTGESSAATADIQEQLAIAYRRSRKYEESLEGHQRTLKIRQQVLGESHPDSLMSMSNIGWAFYRLKRTDAAIQMMSNCLKLRQKHLKPTNRNIASSLEALSIFHASLKQWSPAFACARERVNLLTQRWGESSKENLEAMQDLADLYQKAGQVENQLATLSDRIKLKEKANVLNRRFIDDDYNQLAIAYRKVNEFEQAIALQQKTLGYRRVKRGVDDPKTLTSLGNLAFAYWAAGDYRQSLDSYRELWKLRKKKNGPSHADTLKSLRQCCQLALLNGNDSLCLQLTDEVANLEKEDPKFENKFPATLAAYRSAALLGLQRRQESNASAKDCVERYAQMKNPNTSTFALGRALEALSSGLANEAPRQRFAEAYSTLEKELLTDSLESWRAWKLELITRLRLEWEQENGESGGLKQWQQKTEQLNRRLSEGRRSLLKTRPE